MADERTPTIHERWALLRFSVVGRLLASPPPRGELRAELERLAASAWRHPVTARPTRFGVSTIERWYYQAKHAGTDPVGVLRKRVAGTAGGSPRWASGCGRRSTPSTRRTRAGACSSTTTISASSSNGTPLSARC